MSPASMLSPSKIGRGLMNAMSSASMFGRGVESAANRVTKSATSAPKLAFAKTLSILEVIAAGYNVVPVIMRPANMVARGTMSAMSAMTRKARGDGASAAQGLDDWELESMSIDEHTRANDLHRMGVTASIKEEDIDSVKMADG